MRNPGTMEGVLSEIVLEIGYIETELMPDTKYYPHFRTGWKIRATPFSVYPITFHTEGEPRTVWTYGSK
jgi:hypothetical protein